MNKNVVFPNNSCNGYESFEKTIKDHQLIIISQNKDIFTLKSAYTKIYESSDGEEYVLNLISTSTFDKFFIIHKKLKIYLDLRGAFVKILGCKIYINSIYEEYINDKTWTNEKECVTYTMLLSYNTGCPKYLIFKHPKKYYFIRKNYNSPINIYSDLSASNYELRGWVVGMSSFKNN